MFFQTFHSQDAIIQDNAVTYIYVYHFKHPLKYLHVYVDKYMYAYRVIPREQHADQPPSPLNFSKVFTLRFCSQKIRSVLKRMQKQFSDFLTFFRPTLF